MKRNDIRALAADLAEQAGTLEVVNLSNNNVGDAAGDLGLALARHNKLREQYLKISVVTPCMKPNDIRALAAGLAEQAGTLEVVNLGGNNVGDAAGDLGKALARHNKLRELRLDYFSMEADNVRALAAGLARALEVVKLEGNDLSDAVGDLGQTLARHTGLKTCRHKLVAPE